MVAIAKTEYGRVEFLTNAHDEDGGDLAVFGYEEEAEISSTWVDRDSWARGRAVAARLSPYSGAVLGRRKRGPRPAAGNDVRRDLPSSG